MLMGAAMVRFFNTSSVYCNTTKSLLATLRKKTGYTFTNCKKALELHNNNLQEAEKWLHQQAQALGWSKAAKLEGRETTQGLIGVLINSNNAALVEINCETDFVARNHVFQNMVGDVTKACLQFVERQPESTLPMTKYALNSDELKQLESNGKTLGDLLALTIGSVGENAILKRAHCIRSRHDVQLFGYAHPSGVQVDDVMLGRVGGVVGLKETSALERNLGEIGKQLCLHVVGMDPKKVGTAEDQPADNAEDETCLIHQDFVMDNSVSVQVVLLENGVDVVDFQRMAVGHLESEDQPGYDEENKPLVSVGTV